MKQLARLVAIVVAILISGKSMAADEDFYPFLNEQEIEIFDMASQLYPALFSNGADMARIDVPLNGNTSIIIYKFYPISRVALGVQIAEKVGNTQISSQSNRPFLVTGGPIGNKLKNLGHSGDLWQTLNALMIKNGLTDNDSGDSSDNGGSNGSNNDGSSPSGSGNNTLSDNEGNNYTGLTFPGYPDSYGPFTCVILNSGTQECETAEGNDFSTLRYTYRNDGSLWFVALDMCVLYCDGDGPMGYDWEVNFKWTFDDSDSPTPLVDRYEYSEELFLETVRGVERFAPLTLIWHKGNTQFPENNMRIVEYLEDLSGTGSIFLVKSHCDVGNLGAGSVIRYYSGTITQYSSATETLEEFFDEPGYPWERDYDRDGNTCDFGFAVPPYPKKPNADYNEVPAMPVLFGEGFRFWIQRASEGN